MLHHLETLRNKPQHIKTRYAFLMAFLCTGVIALFWANATINQMSHKEEEVVLDEVDSSLSRQLSKFRDFMHATAVSFKPTVRYIQEEEMIIPNRINLEMLIASSTIQTEVDAQKVATGTQNKRAP